MNLEEIMKKYNQEKNIVADEEEILDTICKSKEVFYQKEQEGMLAYWEFTHIQLKIIRKRWWLLQILLLISAEAIFMALHEEYYIRKGLGITGVLFIVFIIPELWRNKTCNCMEIEASSFYYLKQIYAARIFLFGIMDVFLLTIFCWSLQKNLYFTMMELMIQFLFPITVTACICFWTLCSRHFLSEITSIVLCMLWSAVWCLVTVTEEIYTIVVQPVWICLFGLCSLFLVIVLYKTIHNCDEFWEEDFNGIKCN